MEIRYIHIIDGIFDQRVFVCNFQRSTECKELRSMACVHNDGCVINYGTKILVAGGNEGYITNDDESKTVESFDTETNTWSKLPDLNVARSEAVGSIAWQ